MTPAVYTKRQREILKLRERGLTRKQIAEALVLSVETVKHHIHLINRRKRDAEELTQ